MQLSLAILTYAAAISEVSLFQITILAVQITILVVLKNYYTSSANATAKPLKKYILDIKVNRSCLRTWIKTYTV